MSTPQDPENYDHLPPLCRPGATPDDYRFRLFATLREKWVTQGGDEQRRTYTQLAEMLGVTKQAVSQWATRSGDKSPPPWHVLMRLCHELGYEIVMGPNELVLIKSA